MTGRKPLSAVVQAKRERTRPMFTHRTRPDQIHLYERRKWLGTILKESCKPTKVCTTLTNTSHPSRAIAGDWSKQGSCQPSRCACFRDSSENCSPKSVTMFATTCTPSKIRTCSASGAHALIGNTISTRKGQLSDNADSPISQTSPARNGGFLSLVVPNWYAQYIVHNDNKGTNHQGNIAIPTVFLQNPHISTEVPHSSHE